MEGEFNTMTELHKFAPNFVPKPYTWGKLNIDEPATYFFLCEFIEMTNENPDPVQLCTKLVQLHQKSVSPTGKFGFHIDTCQGPLPQATEWCSSWVDYYIQLTRRAMQLNTEICGPWRDLEQVVEHLIEHVVPKVLGPLEANGRSVKPSLIHGDLWEGNTGISFETGEVYAFDASGHYCHNEMEIAMVLLAIPHVMSKLTVYYQWRMCSQGFGSKTYLNAYLSRMGISEPTEQFDDRNRIYSAYITLFASACHNGGNNYREE